MWKQKGKYSDCKKILQASSKYLAMCSSPWSLYDIHVFYSTFLNERCDAIIKTATHIYAIELKLDKSAKEALEQIFEKQYLHPYQSDPRHKIAVGINFSSGKREIEEYLVKESFSGQWKIPKDYFSATCLTALLNINQYLLIGSNLNLTVLLTR